ncbi:MAG TPA: glycosyltransferase family A protein [Bacillota bacterium]|nr:glycosyltransferase family A protein [Bacillota bacterium]
MSIIKGSIIIPTKDKITRLQLILTALSSQVNENIEVIVVLDGCQPEIILEFDRLELSYHPKKIVSKQNVGRAAARIFRFGWKKCKRIRYFLRLIPKPPRIVIPLSGTPLGSGFISPGFTGYGIS